MSTKRDVSEVAASAVSFEKQGWSSRGQLNSLTQPMIISISQQPDSNDLEIDIKPGRR
jgi:hypothetical protein